MDVVAGDGAEEQPRLPTTPVCSQWEMVLLRTRWRPMVSLFQPLFSARSMVPT